MRRAVTIMKRTLCLSIEKQPEDVRMDSINKDIAHMLCTCLVTPDMAEYARRHGKTVLNLARALDKMPIKPMMTIGKC